MYTNLKRFTGDQVKNKYIQFIEQNQEFTLKQNSDK